MKGAIIVLLGMFVLMGGISVGWAIDEHAEHDHEAMVEGEGMMGGAAVAPEANEDVVIKDYVCPMHPDVHSDAPGNCPKCGMALVARTYDNSEEITDVGNAECPVSGEPISGQHFAVHDGKRYGFCCDMCLRKFKKNPEKYMQ